MLQQKQPNVLIVDSCANHRLLYSACFTTSGYLVTTAATGLQAIEFSKRAKPDIIVLDVDMPEKDGLETLTIIRAKHPHIPIIVNTGYAHFRSDVRSWAADAFMIKSSNIEDLERTVKELLGKRKVTSPKVRHSYLQHIELKRMRDISGIDGGQSWLLKQ